MTFTVRHFERHTGEIISHHENRIAAALAYALAVPAASYAELRDSRTNRMLASFDARTGATWHAKPVLVRTPDFEE
jgi:hypothetical protein